MADRITYVVYYEIQKRSNEYRCFNPATGKFFNVAGYDELYKIGRKYKRLV